MSATSPSNEIGYAEFGEWYDNLQTQVLEPALVAAEASLQRSLAALLSERDLTRIRATTGRVKSKRRAWRKIQQPQYVGQLTSVEEIPRVIHDLIGLRVTCINLRDIDLIQTALEGLPHEAGQGLWLDRSSERDYVAEPKASGYRGWHINLGIEVDSTPVICELQVRSLLQDSWGELTHAEQYSKDGALPPLVDVLSTRMADLLAILDDIAEDLRTELDRIDQEVVAERDGGSGAATDALAGQAADAAALLRGRWESIDRPTDLASLAWMLQRDFGAEVSDDWFGHSSFKRFLKHAIPEGEISTGRQAYLLPIKSAESGASDDDSSSDVPVDDSADGNSRSDRLTPGAARQMRRIDSEFPLIAGAEWPILFERLAESWRRVKPVDSTAGTVNRLARSARDLTRAAGASFSRRNLDYVIKALLASEELGPLRTGTEPVSGTMLADRYAQLTVQRMVELRVLDNASSKGATRVQNWLAPPSDP